MKIRMSFEDRLQRMQDIVAGLESGTLPLEESVGLYKEGLALSRQCREQLEKARNEIRLLSDGEFKPFDPESQEQQEDEHAS